MSFIRRLQLRVCGMQQGPRMCRVAMQEQRRPFPWAACGKDVHGHKTWHGARKLVAVEWTETAGVSMHGDEAGEKRGGTLQWETSGGKGEKYHVSIS